MGCPVSKSGAAAPVAVPDSGAPAVQLTCTEVTSVIDAKITGMFSKHMSSQPREQGALYDHVTAASDQGLELVISFPKVESPEMPTAGQQLALATGQATTISCKTTLTTIFKELKAGQTLDTLLVYAPLTINSSIGFLNAKVNMEDTVASTIVQYAAQGYKLAGMGIASGSASISTRLDAADSSCESLTELVFQKVEPSNEASVSITQSAISVSVNRGKMKSTVPDFMPFLTDMGSQGYTLSGFLLPPSEPPPMMQTSFKYDMPVLTVMLSGAIPMKFCSIIFEYTMDMGGGQAVAKGDPVPLINAYAEKGWVIKGALNLPPEQKMSGLTMPVLMIFEAPIDSTSVEGIVVQD